MKSKSVHNKITKLKKKNANFFKKFKVNYYNLYHEWILLVRTNPTLKSPHTFYANTNIFHTFPSHFVANVPILF